jgi:signal transduction histidine kinase
VSRARTLVDRILAFGRRRVAPPRPVRLADLMAESISLLRAGHDDARIVADLEAPPSVRVLGDPAELQQVLLNLGSNAIQASRPGEEVRFGAKPVRLTRPRMLRGVELPPGDYVVLWVEDDGAGMEPEILMRIFEPFFTMRDQGHGLGLATVGEIVRDHGGGISVSSVPGRGSRFRVYLPVIGPRRTPPCHSRPPARCG